MSRLGVQFPSLAPFVITLGTPYLYGVFCISDLLFESYIYANIFIHDKSLTKKGVIMVKKKNIDSFNEADQAILTYKSEKCAF